MAQKFTSRQGRNDEAFEKLEMLNIGLISRELIIRWTLRAAPLLNDRFIIKK